MSQTNNFGIQSFYKSKIEALSVIINDKTHDLRRLEAQRNILNSRGTHNCL